MEPKPATVVRAAMAMGFPVSRMTRSMWCPSSSR